MLCVISSGNWNNSSNAGAWNANLNNTRTNANNNVAFRADSAPDSLRGDPAGRLAKREPASRSTASAGGAKSLSAPLFAVRPARVPVASWAVFSVLGACQALARDYPALAAALPPPLRRDHESVIAADNASRRPPN